MLSSRPLDESQGVTTGEDDGLELLHQLRRKCIARVLLEASTTTSTSGEPPSPSSSPQTQTRPGGREPGLGPGLGLCRKTTETLKALLKQYQLELDFAQVLQSAVASDAIASSTVSSGTGTASSTDKSSVQHGASKMKKERMGATAATVAAATANAESVTTGDNSIIDKTGSQASETGTGAIVSKTKMKKIAKHGNKQGSHAGTADGPVWRYSIPAETGIQVRSLAAI